ncbi:MAG: molecular chaperone DnaJ, partial [Clostridia bacterium]|nr:molecular chaperone DnaJ [Clostridia bacterium]
DLPAGITSGSVLKLKGHGIATKRGTGDMYVTIQVDIPQKLNKDQIAKIKALDGVIKPDQFPQVKEFNKQAKK